LHDELDIDHATMVVFQVEQFAAIGMAFEHARAHRQHIVA